MRKYSKVLAAAVLVAAGASSADAAITFKLLNAGNTASQTVSAGDIGTTYTLKVVAEVTGVAAGTEGFQYAQLYFNSPDGVVGANLGGATYNGSFATINNIPPSGTSNILYGDIDGDTYSDIGGALGSTNANNFYYPRAGSVVIGSSFELGTIDVTVAAVSGSGSSTVTWGFRSNSSGTPFSASGVWRVDGAAKGPSSDTYSFQAYTFNVVPSGTPKFNIAPTSVTLSTLVGAQTVSDTLTVTNNGTLAGDVTLSTPSSPLSLSGNSATNVAINGTFSPTISLATGSYANGVQNINITQNASDTGNVSTAVTYNVGNATTGPGNTFGTALSGLAGVSGTLASKTTSTEAIAELVDNGSSMSMAWRDATVGETFVQGDVVKITTDDPNVYVLKMTYGSDVNENSFFLGEFVGGNWANAGFDANAKLGAWSGQNTLGQWGIDTTGTGGYVWAVVNGGGDFAVIPEPTSLALLGLGAAGLLARRKKA